MTSRSDPMLSGGSLCRSTNWDHVAAIVRNGSAADGSHNDKVEFQMCQQATIDFSVVSRNGEVKNMPRLCM